MDTSRLRIVTSALLLGLVLGGMRVEATPKATLPVEAGEDTAASRFRRLPPYFGKLKLKEQQIEEVYEIRQAFGEKIAKLQRQIDDLKSEQSESLDDVLTRTQRTALAKLKAAAGSKSGSAKKSTKGVQNKSTARKPTQKKTSRSTKSSKSKSDSSEKSSKKKADDSGDDKDKSQRSE